MNPNDIVAQMLGLAQASNANIGSQQEILKGQIADETAQAAVAAQRGTSMVANIGEAARQKAEIDYTTAKYGEQVQAMAGLNPDDLQNEVAKSLATINSAQAIKQQELAKYQQLQSVDFMQNPIGYVLAQLQTSGVVQRHNAAADLENSAFENVQQRTSLINQVKSSVSANTAAEIRKQQLVAAEVAVQDAQMKVDAERARSSSLIAQRTNQIAQLEDKKFDNMRAVLNTQIQVQNTQAAMAQAAELRAARAEQAAALRAAKATQAAAEADLDSRLATMSALIGRPGAMSLDTLKRTADKKLATRWATAADTGTLGANLGDAVMFVAEQGNPNRLATENAPLFKMVRGSYGAIKSTADALTIAATRKGEKAPKPEVAWEAAAQKYETDIINSVNTKNSEYPANSSYWEEKFNPMRAPYAVLADEAAAGKIPQLKNNVVVKTVSNLLATKGGGDISPADETTVFRTVAEQVKSGAIGPAAAAAQVAEFYNVAAEKARTMYAIEQFNLPAPAHYYMNVPIPEANFMGKTIGIAAFLPTSALTKDVATPVDLRNQSAVEKALAQMASRIPVSTK